MFELEYSDTTRHASHFAGTYETVEQAWVDSLRLMDDPRVLTTTIYAPHATYVWSDHR